MATSLSSGSSFQQQVIINFDITSYSICVTCMFQIQLIMSFYAPTPMRASSVTPELPKLPGSARGDNAMSRSANNMRHYFNPARLDRLRDWSLITGRGGATKREGGHVKFYPYEKGGQKKF